MSGARRYGHGLVLGKFYPPHAGHHHLVRTAQDQCERLTVLVCAASVESVPLADRVAWMREEHPGADVVG
ncbi:adenylyltransferase/cytidyltransferase family protein, partial [Streptomyces katrae]|uniref:adenylyltransferase/cytidyltransferase family protein n=2 Tax=Streptomyces TaxID=1883 RepID=UPI0014705526